jgi:hypothetical protein
MSGELELVLPESHKQRLQARLQPIVAAGALPKTTDPYQQPELNAQVQAVVGKILEEELPSKFIKKFREIQKGSQQVAVFKNFPTLDWMLPPTPEKHDYDHVGGYSNLILMGLSQLDGSQAFDVDNIVAQKGYKRIKLAHGEKLRKHRDSGDDKTNALFCLKGLDVSTNLYAFDDIAKHADISPYLDILKSNSFQIHELGDDDQVTEVKGPFPIFIEEDTGHIHGSEIYNYGRDFLRRVVPITDEAQQAWDALCNLVNSEHLQPSVSVILEKGDILVFHEKSGLHDRDAYAVPEDEFSRRWLKRASKGGEIQTHYESSELLQLEKNLPEIIANARNAKGLDTPYYAAFLSSQFQR